MQRKRRKPIRSTIHFAALVAFAFVLKWIGFAVLADSAARKADTIWKPLQRRKSKRRGRPTSGA